MSYLSRILRLPSKLRRKARRSRMTLFLLLAGLSVVLLAPLYLIYKPPALLITYFQSRWPYVLWRVSTSSKIIALTIDDGPSEYTHEITELLKDEDASATFFVIGSQVAGREETLRELIRSGNELGNHAMRDEPSRLLDDSNLLSQIKSVENMIHEAYDAVEVARPPRYFRPGSGFFNQRIRQITDKLNYRVVLGDVYPHDPQIPHPSINAKHILSMVSPGSIVICHDRRSWTVPMLRKVLPELRRRGYRAVTLTKLLKESQEFKKL